MVRELLDQIDKAAASGDYFLALFGALTIPSICGALESANGEDDKPKYIAWFDKWVAKKYVVGPNRQPSFSGEQCYSFRCAMLHQGRAQHKGLGYTRVLFLEPTVAMRRGLVLHNNILNDALNLDVRSFCGDLVGSAREWLATVAGTEPFETNLKSTVRRYPSGILPYIGGAPVIS